MRHIFSGEGRSISALREAARQAQGGAISVLSRASQRHNGSAILVSGVARSGTTWLQRQMAIAIDAFPVYEPFRPATDPKARSVMPEELEWLRRERSSPSDRAFLEFFDDVQHARHLTRWSASQGTLMTLVRSSNFVVKEIRLNRALGWLAVQRPDVPKVFLLRHPCAVVASMMRSPGPWHNWDQDHPAVSEGLEIAGVKTPSTSRAPSLVTLLATFWALDVQEALTSTRPDELEVILYEDLVADPTRVVQDVLSSLGFHVRTVDLTSWEEPSATTNLNSPLTFGLDSRSAWRKELSRDQIREIFFIIAEIGMDLYDHLSGAPRLDQLSRCRL